MPIAHDIIIAAALFATVMSAAWLLARLISWWRWGRKRTYYVRRRRHRGF